MSLTERLVRARLEFERRTGRPATTAVLSIEDARIARQYYAHIDPATPFLGNVFGMDILAGEKPTGEPELS